MNTLEQRRAETVEKITGELYAGNEDRAAELALSVAMSDGEFSRLQEAVRKAQTAVATVEAHEKQRDEIATARAKAEQALAALAEKRRTFLAEIERDAAGHRAILGAAKQADSARNAAMRDLRGTTETAGLLPCLPGWFREDHAKRERAAGDAEAARAKAKKRRALENERDEIQSELERLREKRSRFLGPQPDDGQFKAGIEKLQKMLKRIDEELLAQD
jgi:hypothetical protein